ncbi:MAG: LytR C-terminal domain-containing protein [Bacteroidetes bacterium]|nr:LytR C-terminal domain-containing protein [Bacteroidota bacterium]
MKDELKKSLLLNTVIVCLAAFCLFQLYGIFFGDAIESPVQKNTGNPVDDTTFAAIQINILNGCGVNGVGQTLMNFCRKAGYDVVEMGNYKSFTIEHSMVIDRIGKPELSARLARQLGISAENIVTQFSSGHLVTASVIIGKDFQELQPWK